MAIEGHPLYWAGIAIGLMIEWPFVGLITARRWTRSFAPTVTMNLASAVVGFFAIPALGGLWEIGPGDVLDKNFALPTFNLISWTVTGFIAIAVNVLVEGMVLSRAFKAKVSSRNAGLLVAANVLSVGIAFGAVLLSSAMK